MKKIEFIAICLLMVGCAVPLQPRNISFNNDYFSRYAGAGDSKIVGQAFLKTRGGEVRYGAGNEVRLIPVTPYTQEDFDGGIVRGEPLTPVDSRVFQYIRKAIVGGQGDFEFKDLPAGDYIVTCIITWEVPGRYGLTPTGAVAYATVSVKSGETAKAIVTRY